MSYTPPPSPPLGQPGPTPAGWSPRQVVAGVALGAALVLGGLGIGFLLFGGDDEPETDTTAAQGDASADGGGRAGSGGEPSDGPEFDDEPFRDDLSDLLDGDLSDLLDGDLGDFLPEGFEDLLPDGSGDLEDLFENSPLTGGVQATVLFRPDATSAQTRSIERAWRRQPLLSPVVLMSADDLEDLTGGTLPPGVFNSVLSGFAAAEDAERVRRFVCRFADDPGVQVVQLIGTRPCDQER